MRKVYLLPNLFTTGNFFCGIVSMTHAMSGRFVGASIWILIALLFDFVDGQMARMSNTTSKFGEQYDSLADLVTFGIAPAILMYEMILHRLGRFGLAIAFIYSVCCALRLARFNARIKSDVKSKFFEGLPTPSAAALIASSVLAASRYEWTVVISAIPFFMLVVAFLMVSNLEYPSPQAIGIRKKKPFLYLVFAIITLGGLIFFVELFLMVFTISYALLGIIGDRLSSKEVTIQSEEVHNTHA